MAKQPRKHHYIPQFYLSGFSETGSADGTLYVLDFQLMKQWKSTSRGTAHERDYHVVELGADRDPMFVEKKLGEREGKWATVLRSVLESHDLPKGELFAELLAFIAFLAVRVPPIRNQVTDFIDRASKAQLRATFATPEGRDRLRSIIAEHCRTLPLSDQEKIKQLLQADPDLEEMAEYVNSDRYEVGYEQTWNVQTMVQMAITLLPVLGRRKWSLWSVATDAPDLICSDCPVCLTWAKDVHGPYSPGFGLSNTLVTVPLGNRLLLSSTFEGLEAVTLDCKGVAAMNARASMFANKLYTSKTEFVWLTKEGALGSVGDLLRGLSPGNTR
jgi:hypothetical protein